MRFCPYTAKCGSGKTHISAFFTQWDPRKGVLIFNKAGDGRAVTILQIYFLDDFYYMYTTAIFCSTYYQKTHIKDCVAMFASSAKQPSNESGFNTGKALWKTYWRPETSNANMMALSRVPVVIISMQKKKKERDRYI